MLRKIFVCIFFFAVFLVVYPGEGNLWSLKIMLI